MRNYYALVILVFVLIGCAPEINDSQEITGIEGTTCYIQDDQSQWILMDGYYDFYIDTYDVLGCKQHADCAEALTKVVVEAQRECQERDVCFSNDIELFGDALLESQAFENSFPSKINQMLNDGTIRCGGIREMMEARHPDFYKDME